MNPRPIFRVIPAVILAALLVSCTPNGGSIFYILENETEQPQSNLGNLLSIFDVAKIGNDFYAAAGSIFKGVGDGTGNVQWVPIDKKSPPQSGALCNALVSFQSNLYGGFFTPGSNLGLYQASGDDFPTTPTPLVDPGASPRAQIIKLIVASSGPTLLVITATPISGAGPSDPPFYYTLYSSTDGTAYTTLLGGSGWKTPINDATYDGANYYAVSGSQVYRGAASPLSSMNINTGDVLQGVFLNSGVVYVSSKASGIYYYNGAWNSISADTQGGTAVSYFGISGPVTIASGHNLLLIGSEGYGYYYLDLTSNTLSRSADTTMITLSLYTAVIRKMVIDSSTVFACTAGNGLWKGKLDATNASGVSGWTIQ
jgi:hypothetical protein